MFLLLCLNLDSAVSPAHSTSNTGTVRKCPAGLARIRSDIRIGSRGDTRVAGASVEDFRVSFKRESFLA